MRILGEKALLPTGWSNDVLVTISADGRIADVQANAGNAAYDARYPVLLPAPANLHSQHFPMSLETPMHLPAVSCHKSICGASCSHIRI